MSFLNSVLFFEIVALLAFFSFLPSCIWLDFNSIEINFNSPHFLKPWIFLCLLPTSYFILCSPCLHLLLFFHRFLTLLFSCSVPYWLLINFLWIFPFGYLVLASTVFHDPSFVPFLLYHHQDWSLFLFTNIIFWDSSIIGRNLSILLDRYKPAYHIR